MKSKILVDDNERLRILESHIRAGYRTNIFESRINLNEDEFGADVSPDNILKSYETLKKYFDTSMNPLNEMKSLIALKRSGTSTGGYLNTWYGNTRDLLNKEKINKVKKPIDFINQNQSKYNGIYYLEQVLIQYMAQPNKTEITHIIIKPGTDKIETTDIPAPPPKEPIIFQPADAELKVEGGDGNKVFIDNQSEPLQDTLTIIETQLKEELSEALTKEFESNPELKVEYDKDPSQFKWECTDLKVLSSASRFRNTGEASELNFISLSKLRAEKGYEAVKNIIAKYCFFGAEFEKNKEGGVIDYYGENGDGSSGPVVPSGNYVADLSKEGPNLVGTKPVYYAPGTDEHKQMWEETKNKYKGPPTEDDLKVAQENARKKLKELQKKDPNAKYPEPKGIKDLYDQYKYFRVATAFRLTFEPKDEVEKEKEKPDVKITKIPQFNVAFTVQKQTSTSTSTKRNRWFKFPFKKRRRNNKRSKNSGSTKCSFINLRGKVGKGF